MRGCDNCGTRCNSCENCGDCDNICNKCALQWELSGCYLYARIDGCDLDPLDLCSWLYCHQTDTKMQLVFDYENGSYIEYFSERDIDPCTDEAPDTDKIYICDLLSGGNIYCLADVCYDPETIEPCSFLVFDPCCGDETCEACAGECANDKWRPYKIPRVEECDGEKVLGLNDCGCIVEKCLTPNQAFRYMLRDSYPDDPDWPYIYGSFGFKTNYPNVKDIVDLELQTRIPQAMRAHDLIVTINYCVEAIRPSVMPQYHYSAYDEFEINGTAMITSEAVISKGTQVYPWGTNEWQVSKTLLVPAGGNVRILHSANIRTEASFPNVAHNATYDGKQYPQNPEEHPTTDSALYAASRLHGVTVTVQITDLKGQPYTDYNHPAIPAGDLR